MYEVVCIVARRVIKLISIMYPFWECMLLGWRWDVIVLGVGGGGGGGLGVVGGYGLLGQLRPSDGCN